MTFGKLSFNSPRVPTLADATPRQPEPLLPAR
jgi:hypothetical protein